MKRAARLGWPGKPAGRVPLVFAFGGQDQQVMQMQQMTILRNADLGIDHLVVLVRLVCDGLRARYGAVWVGLVVTLRSVRR